MKTYTFEVVCASGTTRTFTCEAENFNQARTLLTDFVEKN